MVNAHREREEVTSGDVTRRNTCATACIKGHGRSRGDGGDVRVRNEGCIYVRVIKTLELYSGV